MQNRTGTYDEHEDFVIRTRVPGDELAAQMLRVAGADVQMLTNGDLYVTGANADTHDSASRYGNVSQAGALIYKL